MINPKFVYFDIGGVLIKDFSASNKWNEVEKELGIATDDPEFMKFWDKYEPDICLGLDTDSLMPLIEKGFKVHIPFGYSLMKDGFVKRFEKNETIWPVVKIFRKKYKVGLLTNMYPGMLAEIQRRNLLPKVKWDSIIDSSIEKVSKPHKEIFDLSEKRAGFKGSEIFFIDNSQKHIKAANNFGWQTFFYDSTDYIKSSENLNKFING